MAVFKGDRIRPEVREKLIGVVRNGRMSREMFWRREKGVGSKEQVVAWFDITSRERGLKQVKPSDMRIGGGTFWVGIGLNEELMYYSFLVK